MQMVIMSLILMLYQNYNRYTQFQTINKVVFFYIIHSLFLES